MQIWVGFGLLFDYGFLLIKSEGYDLFEGFENLRILFKLYNSYD